MNENIGTILERDHLVEGSEVEGGNKSKLRNRSEQSEQKKRAHSDSMLYGFHSAQDAMPRMPNEKYLTVSNSTECASSLVITSSTQSSGYNFCTWVSIPSSCRDDKNEKTSDSLKLTQNKCLRLTGMSPSSPKKSPKDYWLLKHNSTHRHDLITDKGDVFTFDETSNLQSRRTLSTILDNSPEGEELVAQPGTLGATDSKLNGELQCLKHKKYLQNKYQQQSSSSMESDDVFLDTTDFSISHQINKKDFKDFPKVEEMDTNEKEETSSKDHVTFTVFPFPPHRRFYRDPCLSESESGLLSPAAMSSIASSPGVLSPAGACDNSSPIAIGLEKFVLSSETSSSRNNSGDFGARAKECSCSVPQKLSSSSEMHSKPFIRPRNVIFDHTTNSPVFPNNAGSYLASAGDGFLCKVPMKLKTEEGSQLSYLVQGDEVRKQAKVNLFPLSNFQSPVLPSVRNTSFPSSNISLTPTSSDIQFSHSSEPDLLKDISVGDGSRNHICQICDRVFSRSDMLSRHMRLHTGQRPYECRTCGQVFSRSDHLQTHLRTHTGEKPYRCSQCSYAAPRRDMVTRHMRVHARGKMRKGRRTGVDVESPPPSPFHSYIIIDEKYFARSKPAEICQKEPLASLHPSGSETPRQFAHSNVVNDQVNADLIKSSSSNLTNQNAFDGSIQLPSIDITKSSGDRSECPLDLSIQSYSPDHLKGGQHLTSHLTIQENVDWKKLSKAQIEKKKNRKWSLADVSSAKCAHITEDRQASLSAAGSPMARSDSTMSIDSGVSYATPTSLIHSICSPGQISSDSPEVFTPGHGGEPTFFLWPSVAHGSPGRVVVDGRMQQHDSIFCP